MASEYCCSETTQWRQEKTMVPKGVVNAYVRRIVDYKEITIDDVPKQARTAVEEALGEDARPYCDCQNSAHNTKHQI